MFRKESQKPRHGNKRCDEWRIEAGICGSLRPRRNKPRRGVAIAGAAAGSFALGALALGLLVIARRRRRLVAVDRLRRRGEIGRASCRERVCPYVKISVVAVSSKKRKIANNYS